MAAAKDRLTDPATKAHWHSCAECTQNVDEWRATCAELAPLHASPAASAKNPCPSDEDLFSFSAGIDPPDIPIATHIVECGRCAAILRDALDPATDDPTIPLILKTSTPQWQTAMAEKLAGVNPPIPSRARMSPTRKLASFRPPTELSDFSQGRFLAADERTSLVQQPAPLNTSTISPHGLQAASSDVKPLPSKRPNYWYIAAAAAALILATSGLWWTLRQRSDPAQLLAQAYTAQRPFEYRLPDSGYSPVQQQRGGVGSYFDHPQFLSEAQSIIQKELSVNKENPAVLAVHGRAQLLQGDYAGAVESLTRANSARPGDPQIMADLACAYAVRGDTENQITDYQHSLNLFQQSLAKRPSDKQILFNIAIIYERLRLPDQALAAWEKFLTEENALGWKDEAKQHITDIEKLRKAKKLQP